MQFFVKYHYVFVIVKPINTLLDFKLQIFDDHNFITNSTLVHNSGKYTCTTTWKNYAYSFLHLVRGPCKYRNKDTISGLKMTKSVWHIGTFPKRNGNSVDSGNLLNY